VLTLAGRDALGKLVLTIPNQVIHKLYVERLQERVLPDYGDQEQRQTDCREFYSTVRSSCALTQWSASGWSGWCGEGG